MLFDETLRRAVDRMGVRVEDLAKTLNLNQATLYAWLAGKARPTRPENLKALADTLPIPHRCEVILAWLRDFCPAACAGLLEAGAMREDPHPYTTPLDQALDELRRAVRTSDDLRVLVFDLARLARGL
ncbi:MAG: hypothetical protein HW378_211 [Anaerolineales bacterium]|nr:hypothetical protein [Anaerolineales bacterium]